MGPAPPPAPGNAKTNTNVDKTTHRSQQCKPSSTEPTQQLQAHSGSLPRRPSCRRTRGCCRTGSSRSHPGPGLRPGRGRRRVGAGDTPRGGRRGRSRGPRGRGSPAAGGAGGRRAGGGGGHGDTIGLADLVGETDGGGLVGGVAGADQAAGYGADEVLVATDALGVGAAVAVGAA